MIRKCLQRQGALSVRSHSSQLYNAIIPNYSQRQTGHRPLETPSGDALNYFGLYRHFAVPRPTNRRRSRSTRDL